MSDKVLVSILMSTYKDSPDYLKSSISSILNQTFCNFELIIVNDDPDGFIQEQIILSFNDSRIHYIKNNQNIGLAMSMNKAAMTAVSDIYMRMDADDICYPNRIADEYKAISEGGYDVVFGSYININEKSETISGVIGKINCKPELLNRFINLNPNCIHHPTTMFRKSIFDKIGGYRDFPCSQDSDLWLRMAEAGAKFIALDIPLIKYRINTLGISRLNHYKQQLTIYYCYKLSLQRLIKGKDNFSKENYNSFLKRYNFDVPSKNKKFEMQYKYLIKSALIKTRHPIVSILLKIYTMIIITPLRRHILDLTLKKVLMNFCGLKYKFN